MEAVLHLIPAGDTILGCRTSDEALHHKFIPNSKCVSKTPEWNVTYEINNLGLRDDKLEPEKADTYRILVLGDSFVEGYGVESKDRFTDLLEKKLNDTYPFNIEVINAGVSSYSPVLELEFLKMNFEKVNPDLILVALDLTDFKDEIGYYNFLNEKSSGNFTKESKVERVEDNKNLDNKSTGEYVKAVGLINTKQEDIQKYKAQSRWQINESISPTMRIKMLFRKSKLYVLITNEIKHLMNKPYLSYGSPPLIEGDVETDLFAVVRENIDPTVYGSLWILPKKSFSDIALFAREKGSSVAFFTYPHGMQVDGKQWSRGRLTRGFRRGFVYSSRSLDDFVLFGRELDVPSVSLLSDFVKNKGEVMYLKYDGHFNKLGHMVAAEGLFNFLVSSNLIN